MFAEPTTKNGLKYSEILIFSFLASENFSNTAIPAALFFVIIFFISSTVNIPSSTSNGSWTVIVAVLVILCVSGCKFNFKSVIV